MILSLSGFLFEDNYATQSVTYEEFCRIARMAGYQGVELRDTQYELTTIRPIEKKNWILQAIMVYA